MSAQPWSRAWRTAAREFWSVHRSRDHFTTSAGRALADRLAAEILAVDARLGHPDDVCVIDIGCGDGQLLDHLAERCSTLGDRVRWRGVDIGPYPRHGAGSPIEFAQAELPGDLAGIPLRGFVMAHEWLDEVPCDVVERDSRGVDRLVLVERDGSEVLGPSIDDDDVCADHGVDAESLRRWLACWWPLRRPGDRAEVGLSRDQAWAWLVGLIDEGCVMATDYGHTAQQRRERYPRGTLTGYRSGRVVRPVPDGTVNLTAHVAMDSCAAAWPGTSITRQCEEMGAPSLSPQPTPAEVEDYFAALRLRDPGRLGEVLWLRYETG